MAKTELVDRVLAVLSARGWSPYQWAKNARLSGSTVRNMISRRSTASEPETLRAMAEAAGVSLLWLAIVGGSKKHGGPDLGPTRAREKWATLGVDGIGIADEAPGPECPADFMPRLTVPMVARIQGFKDSWQFVGRKTASYRQVGNAFPPPVAEAVGRAIHAALTSRIPGRRLGARGRGDRAADWTTPP